MLLCTSTARRALSNNMIINGVDANSIGTGEKPKSFLSRPWIRSRNSSCKPACTMPPLAVARVAMWPAVTKSGTNRLHWRCYEFLRNTVLDANNFFLNGEEGPVTARPAYRRNQFGGTLGGPLLKDRAWFFISYQGTRETNGTSLTNSLSTMFLPNYLGPQRDSASLANLSLCYNPGSLGTLIQWP